MAKANLAEATKRMKEIAEEKEKAKGKPKEDNIKVTLYITANQMFALEDIRRKRLKGGLPLGEVDKSKLMREALDLLIEKEK